MATALHSDDLAGSMPRGSASSIRAGNALAAFISTIFTTFDLADPLGCFESDPSVFQVPEPTLWRELVPRQGIDVPRLSKKYGLRCRLNLLLSRHLLLVNLGPRFVRILAPKPDYHNLGIDYSESANVSSARIFARCCILTT